MASFRASLIAEIRNNYSIRTIAQKVNSLLYESIKPGNFVTAVYCVLDSQNHIITFCNCGHDLPILLRKDGEVEFLREGGPVLGVTTGIEYEERPIFLSPGEVVAFYTDGVTEVFDKKGEQFGIDRLIKCIKDNRNEPAHKIQTIIHRAVNDNVVTRITYQTIHVPAPGYILAIASGSFQWGDYGPAWLAICDEVSEDPSSTTHYTYVKKDGNHYNSASVFCERVINVTSAGSYTYHFNAYVNDASGIPSFMHNGRIDLIYIPTSYGTVSSSVSESEVELKNLNK